MCENDIFVKVPEKIITEHVRVTMYLNVCSLSHAECIRVVHLCVSKHTFIFTHTHTGVHIHTNVYVHTQTFTHTHMQHKCLKLYHSNRREPNSSILPNTRADEALSLNDPKAPVSHVTRMDLPA